MLIDKARVLDELVPEGIPAPLDVIDDRQPVKGGAVYHQEWRLYAIKTHSPRPGWVLTTGIRSELAVMNLEQTHRIFVDRSFNIHDLGPTKPFEDPEQTKYQRDLDAERERQLQASRDRQQAAERRENERRDWWPGKDPAVKMKKPKGWMEKQL